MSTKTIVKPSNVHGKGLFAAQKILAGEVIGEFFGKPTLTDGDHVLWLSESQGIEVICDFRFINHSDQPNAYYCNDGTVVALKTIQPEVEILHDYGGE